jgi:X-Pro dipeptidyl-peptidase
MDDRCLFMRQFFLDHQDRVTGDWNAFWQARDYLHRTGRIRASVFAVHGLNDFNVRTKAFASWWERLTARRLPRKLWLHNGGHGGPGGAAYKLAENRWFDHWLFGVDNGIMREPRVHIQREDGHYDDEADWPAPGTRTATLRLSATDAAAPGTLSTHGGGSHEQSFIDRGRELDTDDVLIQNPDTATPNRLVYRSATLTRAARLSGTPWVDLRMSIDNRDDANLTAVLVDYGPGAPEMVTRGWLDPQNRDSLTHSKPITQGHEYGLRWDLQPDDHVFAAGHRIGLVVVSTDHDYTLRPAPGTQLTLDPRGSRLRLPVVGGL